MEFITSDAPIQQIVHSDFKKKDIELFIKREDLVHPTISGNKFWKLKYNLIEAQKQGYTSLVSFGGAFSNHIYSLAAAGKAFGFKTVGVIRGEEFSVLNPTLQYAVDSGMELYYLNRELYREKDGPQVHRLLEEKFGEFYLIPEGGSNAMAVKGCMEMMEGVEGFDVVSCPVGTGGTLAGMIASQQSKTTMLGFSALKGGEFLRDEVDNLLNQSGFKAKNHWDINTEYHFGGYAKTTNELFEFIRNFKSQHEIQLEPIYTAKMMYGIIDLIKNDYFQRGSKLLAIHTGGLQGLKGFPDL